VSRTAYTLVMLAIGSAVGALVMVLIGAFGLVMAISALCLGALAWLGACIGLLVCAGGLVFALFYTVWAVCITGPMGVFGLLGIFVIHKHLQLQDALNGRDPRPRNAL
jgi:hypothetical protein